MPQPFGSPGGQRGTGYALTFPLTAFAELLIWLEAKAPVTTRDRAKARTMFFMVKLLLAVLKVAVCHISVDRTYDVTIGC
jgi:hypothetical protein